MNNQIQHELSKFSFPPSEGKRSTATDNTTGPTGHCSKKKKTSHTDIEIFERWVDPFVTQTNPLLRSSHHIFESNMISHGPCNCCHSTSSTSSTSSTKLHSYSHLDLDNYIPTCLDQTLEILTNKQADLDSVRALSSGSLLHHNHSYSSPLLRQLSRSVPGYNTPTSSPPSSPKRELSVIEHQLKKLLDHRASTSQCSESMASNPEERRGTISRRLSSIYFNNPKRASVNTELKSTVSDEGTAGDNGDDVVTVSFYSYYDMIESEKDERLLLKRVSSSAASVGSKISHSTSADECNCTVLDSIMFADDMREGDELGASGFDLNDPTWDPKTSTSLSCCSVNELIRSRSMELQFN